MSEKAHSIISGSWHVKHLKTFPKLEALNFFKTDTWEFEHLKIRDLEMVIWEFESLKFPKCEESGHWYENVTIVNFIYKFEKWRLRNFEILKLNNSSINRLLMVHGARLMAYAPIFSRPWALSHEPRGMSHDPWTITINNRLIDELFDYL